MARRFFAKYTKKISNPVDENEKFPIMLQLQPRNCYFNDGAVTSTTLQLLQRRCRNFYDDAVISTTVP
jgi:hypothetical protein